MISIIVVVLLLAPGAAFAQDGTFDSAGTPLYYRSAGSGTPAVLLSGGPGFTVDYMVPVGDFLPADYRRIFFEQRGTGKSRPPTLSPEAMTLQTVVEDLEALRLHLKQERLLLIGHSWGGMLAMAYAAAHPDRVDRVVLIGSGGPTFEFTAGFSDNINMRLRPEDLDGLRKLNRPVLIVQGHQDPIGDKTAEDIHALIPGSTLAYINKAGHFPWIEQPDEFRKIVAAFLGKP